MADLFVMAPLTHFVPAATEPIGTAAPLEQRAQLDSPWQTIWPSVQPPAGGAGGACGGAWLDGGCWVGGWVGGFSVVGLSVGGFSVGGFSVVGGVLVGGAFGPLEPQLPVGAAALELLLSTFGPGLGISMSTLSTVVHPLPTLATNMSGYELSPEPPPVISTEAQFMYISLLPILLNQDQPKRT